MAILKIYLLNILLISECIYSFTIILKIWYLQISYTVRDFVTVYLLFF